MTKKLATFIEGQYFGEFEIFEKKNIRRFNAICKSDQTTLYKI